MLSQAPTQPGRPASRTTDYNEIGKMHQYFRIIPELAKQTGVFSTPRLLGICIWIDNYPQQIINDRKTTRLIDRINLLHA